MRIKAGNAMSEDRGVLTVLAGDGINLGLTDDTGGDAELTVAATAAAVATVAAGSSVGATTVQSASIPSEMYIGRFVAVGAGTANCEIRRINNIVATTLTLNSALKVAHSPGENLWILPGFWAPFEWWGAKADNSTDSYRSLINAFLDQSLGNYYGLIGKGATAYMSSRPLFMQDYTALAYTKLMAHSAFALDCTDGKWNGVPNQYFLTLAGQTGTATFNAATDEVTLSVNPGSAQYSDVIFYPRPGSTMPGGIEEGRRYFTITGNSLTTQLTKSQGVNTPVDITSSGSGELVMVSAGLARMFSQNMMLDGNLIKGLNGFLGLMQQPSTVHSMRIENFAVVGATIGAQQGTFQNLMIFDCWKGLELAGAEMVYFKDGNIESCDTNAEFAETTRNPPGSVANRGSGIGEGFHFESPGRGPSQIQSLVPTGTLTSGTFQLRFKNVLTGVINYNATAAQVQAALEAHAAIGAGNVTCTQITGTNLSDGIIRCDFTVGTLKWEFWEGSTSTTVGGEMAIVNSTIAGGTLAVSYLNPNGRNISYKVGVGNRISGVSMGGAETLNGFTPYFIEFEGTAADPAQGKFQGATLEDIVFFNQGTGAVKDPLHGNTFTSDDTTGCGQYLASYERGGRHAGNVGQHWWFMGDTGRRVKLNTAGKALLEVVAASGMTDNLTEWYDTAATKQLEVTKDAWLKIGGGAAIKKVLSATAVYDPASLADGAVATTTVAVTGATVADSVARASLSTITAVGWIVSAMVTAADTVAVTIMNKTGGVVDLASGTLRVAVTQF